MSARNRSGGGHAAPGRAPAAYTTGAKTPVPSSTRPENNVANNTPDALPHKLRSSPPIEAIPKLRKSPEVEEEPPLGLTNVPRGSLTRSKEHRAPPPPLQKWGEKNNEDAGFNRATCLARPFQYAYQSRWALLMMIALLYAARVFELPRGYRNGAGSKASTSGNSGVQARPPPGHLDSEVPPPSVPPRGYASANTGQLPYSTWNVMPVREMPMPDEFEPNVAEVREAWSPVIKVCGGGGSSSSSNTGTREVVLVFTWSGTKSSYLRNCGLFSGSKTKEYHIYNYGVHKLNDMSSTRQWMRTAEWDTAMKSHYNAPKIIVFNSGHIPASLLNAWPPNSLLLITSDEYNRFGFSHPVIKAKDGGSAIGPHVRKRKFYGPHDADMKRPNGTGWTSSGVNVTCHLDGLFVKNAEEAQFGVCEQQPTKCGNVVDMVTRLRLPPQVTPIFKQYYSRRHARSFPGEFHWFPLGPRFEFHRPSSFPGPEISRRFLFNFIGSPTSLARQRLAAVWGGAAENTGIPKDRVKFHIAQEWAADTSQGNFAPEDYAAVLQESTFTLCPKGNNMDQFRIYEAIESGSIPVIALEGGLANKTLAPDTMTSPIVFIGAWDANGFTQLAAMERDVAGLSVRRKELQKWYQRLLDSTLETLERTLSREHVDFL